MRVLIVLDTFLPAVSGGSELYARSLALGLQAAGHSALVFHTDRGDAPKVERRVVDGIPCVVMHRPRTFRGHGNFFGGSIEEVNVEFNKILDDFRPDVVHINHLKRLSPDIPRLAAERGMPVVFTLHDYWLVCDRSDLLQVGEICTGPTAAKCADCNRGRFARWVNWGEKDRRPLTPLRQALKDWLYYNAERKTAVSAYVDRAKWVDSVISHTNLFIAPSPFLKTTMTQHGVPAEKIVEMDYGMETTPWKDVAPRPRQGRLRCGFFGGISKLKGVHVALKAFESFFDAELHIFGRDYPETRSEFHQIVRQENVKLRGVVSEQAKVDAFSEMDVIIVPSVWYENSPLVIHEAFMAGKPVVASNIGGMADLVPDDVAGLQFEVGNPHDLRRKIARLCNEPELLLRLCRGLPTVTPMTEHVSDLLEIYADLEPEQGRAARRASDAMTTANGRTSSISIRGNHDHK